MIIVLKNQTKETFIVGGLNAQVSGRHYAVNVIHNAYTGFTVHPKTYQSVKKLSPEQRYQLCQEIIKKLGEDFAKDFFTNAKIKYPTKSYVEANTTTPKADVIPFPNKCTAITARAPALDARNMTTEELANLGGFTPIVLHTGGAIKFPKNKLDVLGSKLKTILKLEKEINRYITALVINVLVYLVSGQSVRFNLRKENDKGRISNKVFQILGILGVTCVTGSIAKHMSSFASHKSLPVAVRDLVDTLTQEEQEAILSDFSTVYAYRIDEDKGVVEDKSPLAQEWIEVSKAQDKVNKDSILYYNHPVNLAYKLKVTEEGLLNREYVSGYPMTKKERPHLRIKSYNNTFSRVVEIDTCGAYLNQYRVMLNKEALEDPYNFLIDLMPSRAERKDILLRAICGKPAQTKRYLVSQGYGKKESKAIVDRINKEYPYKEEIWKKLNHDQELVMMSLKKKCTPKGIAFIPNCDGILASGIDQIHFNLVQMYEDSWKEVLGTNIPCKVKCVKEIPDLAIKVA